ncbi:MAG: type II toxin-antitoxin system VapC family toxin [Deltaproteobacteria bacterium]|nr:type II toxin-antitoxin system VapC family toxin [Deltaproteobacteria bacterium]
MTPRYMLDTNMCIYLMKHQPPQVAERFAQCFKGEVVMSSITLAELEYGVACSGVHQMKNQQALHLLLNDIPAAAFDESAAKAYGPVRFAFREKTRDALDKLIAAHAIALQVALVTNNERDFQGYPGLRLENWLTS